MQKVIKNYFFLRCLLLFGLVNFGAVALAQFTVEVREIPFKGLTFSQVNMTSLRENAIGKTARFYIQGGLHGNESLTVDFVNWLKVQLMNKESAFYSLSQIKDISRIEIDLLPIANPNGYQRGSRYNGNQVNLNRNFSILWGLTRENPGSNSFSEPETQVIAQWIGKRNYWAAIDIHGYANMIVLPTALSPEEIKSGDKKNGLQYQRWINGVENVTKNFMPRYELVSGGSLGDGGAFEDWAFWSKGILSFCLEMVSASRFIASESLGLKNTPEKKNNQIDSFEHYEKYLTQILAQAMAIKLDFDPNLGDNLNLSINNSTPKSLTKKIDAKVKSAVKSLIH